MITIKNPTSKTPISTALIFVLVLSSFLSKADICVKSFDQDTADANVIFVGKLVQVEFESYYYRGKPKSIFTFEVKESFKGMYKGIDYVSIVGPIKGCCINIFSRDSTYLVFAYGESTSPGLLWTNDCSHTDLLSTEMETYKKLGTPLIHDPPNPWVMHEDSWLLLKDALYQKISELERSQQILQKSKSELSTQRNVLAIVSAGLMVVLAFLLFRKKKGNATLARTVSSK